MYQSQTSDSGTHPEEEAAVFPQTSNTSLVSHLSFEETKTKITYVSDYTNCWLPFVFLGRRRFPLKLFQVNIEANTLWACILEWSPLETYSCFI